MVHFSVSHLGRIHFHFTLFHIIIHHRHTIHLHSAHIHFVLFHYLNGIVFWRIKFWSRCAHLHTHRHHLLHILYKIRFWNYRCFQYISSSYKCRSFARTILCRSSYLKFSTFWNRHYKIIGFGNANQSFVMFYWNHIKSIGRYEHWVFATKCEPEIRRCGCVYKSKPHALAGLKIWIFLWSTTIDKKLVKIIIWNSHIWHTLPRHL